MTMPNDTTTNDWTNAPAEPGIGDVDAGTSGARAQLKDVKDQVVDHARQSFRQARESAGTSLNDSRHLAADRIGGIANAVRGTSERLRSEQQDRVADLTDSLADNVERLSSYLRDRNLSDFRRDAEDFARRQPAVAVGIALAIGLIGARFLKSGSGGGNYGRV
jgi:ElaB/YqjD/DUF883 family membrane-anchored ribosome-binding protein